MTLSSGKIFGGDKFIWAVLIILACVSILAVYSTSIQLNGTNTTHHLVRHCGTLLLGALSIFAFHKLHSKYYRFVSCFLYCVGVLALIYTALFAPEINGSRRWIFLLGISVQTSDFAKVFLMMFLAHQLSKYEDSINTVGAFLVKVLLPIFIVCILILPSNLSTALLVYANTLVLLFFSNLKKRYVWGLVGATVVGGFLFFGVILYGNIDIWRFPTWHARVEAWLGGDEQSEGQSDDNFQVYSARMAVASGGFLGQGLGNGRAKVVLANAHCDYIFASIVEELGLIVATFLMVLYMWLFARGIAIVKRINKKCPSDVLDQKCKLRQYMVLGLLSMIVIQAFSNILVSVDIMPVTGQTLPFVSYGTSSMTALGIAIGVVLGISKETEGDDDLNATENDIDVLETVSSEEAANSGEEAGVDPVEVLKDLNKPDIEAEEIINDDDIKN